MSVLIGRDFLRNELKAHKHESGGGRDAKNEMVMKIN